jgi:hypothetical protein
MTTAGSGGQASRTVTVRDMQVFPAGQQAGAAGPAGAVPGLGNVVATFCTIPGGSPAQELLVTITGLKLTTSTPAVVLVQPRQAVNQNLGHPDEFAVQVISTSTTQVLVLVRRLDTNAGWGQELRLDLFIVDSVA